MKTQWRNFDRVIEAKGTRADGALYWKAYATEPAGTPRGTRWLRSRHCGATFQTVAGWATHRPWKLKQSRLPQAMNDEDLKLMGSTA